MRYIGSKVKLLNDIEDIIINNTKNCKVFCDLFSGTGIVSKHFKKFFQVYSNDIMFYSYSLLKGNVENNVKPLFLNLKNKLNITNILLYLNNLEKDYNKDTFFVTNNYTPKNSNRMYFSIENGIKIDIIRQEIESWKNTSLINDKEYFYLIASLIESIPYISNITGTYGAYLKQWDSRSLKTLELKELVLFNNDNDNNSFNENSNDLIRKISGDILYIDPPYTNVDYSSAYHVLEAIAKYDNPIIHGITGQRKENNKKSKYCKKNDVEKELEDLIKNANFKYVVLSYSNHGILSEEKLLKIINRYKKNNTEIVFKKIEYRKYKNINSPKNNELFEFIILFEKEEK